MKKHIVLIQSLLLLPLSSASLLFSMNYKKAAVAMKKTANKKATAEKGTTNRANKVESPTLSEIKLLNNTFSQSKEISDEDLAVSMHSQESQPLEIIEETIDLQSISKKEIFYDVHNQLVNHRPSLQPAFLIVPEEHREKFQDIKIILTSDTKPTLKTAEKITVATIAEREDWIEKHNQFQSILNGLETAKENLKTPKLNTPDLAQSMMAVPMPTKKGFEGQLYVLSFVKKAHDLIYDVLADGKFDPANETHVEYLENALEFYVEQKDTEKLMSILDIAQHHTGAIDINEKIARKVHNFLENITAEQEKEAQQVITDKGAEFIKTSNALIKALQEEMDKRVKELRDKHEQYTADCDKTFAEKADYLRALKRGTTNVHGIKPQLQHAKNEPCSDKIKCLSSKHNKVYMTQADVDAIYTNDHLKRKVELDKPMATIQNNTGAILEHISAINRATHKVKLLT